MTNENFNPLLIKNLNNDDKLSKIKIILERTLKRYTADDNKIYANVHYNEHWLTSEQIKTMNLLDIDTIVEDEFFYDVDIFYDLLSLKYYIIEDLKATNCSFIHKDGIVTFKVIFGDKSFEKTFNIELN